MGIAEKTWEVFRGVLTLTGQLDALSQSVKDLRNDVKDLDRRLVRVETLQQIEERFGPLQPKE